MSKKNLKPSLKDANERLKAIKLIRNALSYGSKAHIAATLLCKEQASIVKAIKSKKPSDVIKEHFYEYGNLSH